MSEVVCYNPDGSYLEHFTQWDVDRTLVIKGVEISPEPQIHFSNCMMKRSIVVDPIISQNNVHVKIPNEVLQDALPVSVGVFYKDTTSGGVTRYTMFIPVIPKIRPYGYEYTEVNGGIILNPSNAIIVSDRTPTNRSVLWFNTGV